MKKSITIPKKLKARPFGIFQHPFCRKRPEKMKAEPLRNFFCLKEVALCRNNEKIMKNDKGFFERPFCCKM